MWPFKKKSAVDSIKTIIKVCEDIIRLKSEWLTIIQDKKLSDNKKSLMINRLQSLINIIKNTNLEQISQIKEETGSEKLYSECIAIKEYVDKLDKKLETLKVFEISEIVEKIKNLEDHIYREIETKNLELNEYKIGKLLGQGGNSHTYEIENHPEIVLQTLWSIKGLGFGKKRDIERIKEIMEHSKKVPNGVNFSRIVQYGWKNNYAAIIMERAFGEPIYSRDYNYEQWSKRLEEISNAPQKFYNKLIKDILILHENNLAVDPSKPDNFFYNMERGFYLIDISVGKYLGSLHAPFIFTNRFWNYKEQLTKEDCTNVIQIILKLEKARDSEYGNQKENILNSIKKRFPEIDV